MLPLGDGPFGRYRSTGRENQRRPSAFFAARASFTPSPSVVLFFDAPSMYADSMLILFLPRRFAARASVPGLFASLTSTILRSPEMRYFLTVFGSQHWAERVEGRRVPARHGNIAL